MCGTRASAAKRRMVPGNMPKTRLFGRFFAVFEQRLQAQADAQKRHARADALQQRRAHAHLIQRPHHLAEVADAGQDDLMRAAQPCRVADELIRRAELVQRILDRAQIAGSVIEDR